METDMTDTPGRALRRVSRLVRPNATVDGAGVHLRRSIASAALDYLDPFLLLDQFGSDDPEDYIAGFPMHPHRGIETVTYMLAGVVRHRDTLGNSGTIQSGDVQWMTAGGGIMHEEMPEQREGLLYGFQLWVNLPAKDKMMAPRYQEIPASRIPEVRRADGTSMRVIAGVADGVRGPVQDVIADPTYLDVRVPAGVTFTQPVPPAHTCFAYLFEGRAVFGKEAIDGANEQESQALLILSDGDHVQVTAGDGGARFLLVSGQPLHEPIARYGPFVMNTRAEIQQALQDLRDGTFVYRS
jgi:redox-sensitive bicupin YhaK (pirin superfamily)